MFWSIGVKSNKDRNLMLFCLDWLELGWIGYLEDFPFHNVTEKDLGKFNNIFICNKMHRTSVLKIY